MPVPDRRSFGPRMDDPAGPKPVLEPGRRRDRDLGRDRRSRWVAILTGALSILIGLLYLVMVSVLDRSGPLLPPPPEAFADAPPARPGRSLPGSAAESLPPLGAGMARIAPPVGVADAGPAV